MAFHLIRTRATLASWLVAAALAVATVAIFVTTGCGNFFVPPTSTGTTGTTGTTGNTGTTGTTSNDFAFFTNSSAGSTLLNGYTLSSGSLTATTSSPYSLGIVPQAMAINPANTFLYVASDPSLSTGSIYGFSLSTTGTPSILNSGAALAVENSAAIAISADGKYLFSLNSLSQTLEQYSINTSTGFLTSVGNYPIYQAADGGTIVPSTLRFAPSGNFLVATLGTGGANSYGYSSTSGALTFATVINPGSTSVGIYDVAIDTNNYVYTAGSNSTASPGLKVFSGNTSGVLTLVGSYNTGTSGNAAHAVVVNAAATYVYTGNYTDGTISAYSIGSGGALTAVSGSPFNAPAGVMALARDNSGSYILAEGYSSSSGIEAYSIGASGALTTTATAASGTSTVYPVNIVASH